MPRERLSSMWNNPLISYVHPGRINCFFVEILIEQTEKVNEISDIVKLK